MALYAALRADDIDAVKRCCHPEFVFTSNAHPGRYGEVVEQVGLEHIKPYRELVDRYWEILDKVEGPPRPPLLGLGEPSERGHVFSVILRVKMKHRQSRRIFEGTKRQVWVIQHGQICAMAQYLDKPMIDAMLRLADLEAAA
jgi:ketosteroid isomerase-like protein